MSGKSGKQLTDCPSNLKEAIDWILRVTGKDGQNSSSQDGTDALTKEVTKLLDNVKDVDPGFKKDAFEKVKQALDGGQLITKLAEGLQKFIGYDPSAGGSVFTGPNSKITGAGIAPSNLATYRFCDATIAFTIWVLEGCKSKKGKGVILNNGEESKINGAIKHLQGCYGLGPKGLKNVATQVNASLTSINGSEVEVLVKAIGAKIQSLQSADEKSAQILAKEVGGYLEAVLKAAGFTHTLSNQVDTAFQNLGGKIKGIKDAYDPSKLSSEILMVNVALRLFRSQNATNPLNSALATGVSAFIAHLKAKYESAYNATTTWNESQASKCAIIFLGCIPVIFNAICFFYWKCEKTSWKTMTLGGHGYDLDIMWFMYSMGYSSTFLSGSKTGQAVVSGAFAKFGGFSSVLSLANKPYHDFHAELHKTLPENFNGQTNSSDALRALYYCASYYFTYTHSTISAPTKSPSTIREMLYFLAALPFTPEYGDLEKHIDSLLPRSIPVSMGGIDPSTRLVLNSANIKGNLPTTSLFATRILGLLQGPGNSKQHTSEPWLHELYCNRDFQFKYPAGSALFNALSNYTYALQFQLYFLYKQCSSKYTESCGWRDCRFGSGVHTRIIESYICSAGCSESGHNNGDHSTNPKCKHEDCSTKSPLQAFLTDNLRGFHVNQQANPLSPHHLDNHPTGSLCHVKMGFEAKHFRAENTFKGSSIMYTLNYMCANGSSPFRKIFDYLLFLTKRTPRTLGDLFGFNWQFDAVLTKEASQHSNQFFGYAFLGASLGNKVENNALIGALAKMNGSDKSHASNPTADLMSLYYPLCKSHTSCGPYLNPITYTTGTIFSRNYASTYLSWVLYLADDFYDWLNELLERFDGLKCVSCGNHCNSHSARTHHGEEGACKCPSITQCADVLPLFYEYGFTMLDAKILKGRQTKRTCNAFHTQLNNVINGDPLYKLLIAVDRFLYAIRWEFFSKLSGFWTIYIGLILYTFFFLLDTLHLRSHLKLASSHILPPLALLTSGKPLPITKLTYIGK
ncbi:variant erythrocyte surface antigen-1 family protein [Babesia caballi]|uniref:Variant erythrocyte surface antigen-1 family protein n=1 Tax=Babesia caballi TaxID=5871 RepID=A0AAV4LR18_BABCB|nr:variant erythrocyte surface antigen-1 family protein [Babesia caballi]